MSVQHETVRVAKILNIRILKMQPKIVVLLVMGTFGDFGQNAQLWAFRNGTFDGMK